MGDQTNDQPTFSKARRHFLGLTAATGARLGAFGAIAMFSKAAEARNGNINGVGWGVGGTPPGHGGGARCFLEGTLISTERGEAPIEQLLAGDKIETVRGLHLPVRWISRQTFRRSGPKWLESVTPILVRKHAIADGVPRRDLYLSPTHRLLIDGVFIEAQDLVNGRSIVRVSTEGNRLAYYNLLLETHEAVFAEGAAAASLQLVSRDHERFDNFAELDHIPGCERRQDMTPYARTLGSGGREHLKALLRLGIAPVVRLRDPLQEAHQRIALRSEQLVS